MLAFAFLAASFPASNSDLWLHLATGRALAHGEYTFGADPFGYTTQNSYWPNHAWLFDLSLFAGFQTLGGAGLVALKAGGVLGLAALLLRMARTTGPFWVSGVCVLLALLAMSPGLLLQPACISLLLLALCLCLLQTGGRAKFMLLAVIVLWVNIDSWFLLGPLVIVLFAVGQRLACSDGKVERVPFWLIPASVLACLIGPHHFHALTLPAELSPAVWNSELRHDARFAGFFASPWSAEQMGPSGGFNLSAWAYFALLAIGLVSFVVNSRGLRTWRLPVWIVLALLGGWQARLVPFFAVIAGPIAALNLRERMVDRRGQFLGRSFLAVLTLAMLALTWPGWLQGFNGRDRAMGWAIQPDKGLQQSAERRAAWRRAGLLDDMDRTFHVHPDSAHYAVWFNPGERVFLDSRLKLYCHVSDEYAALSRAAGFPAKPRDRFPGEADPIVRDRRITLLVVHDPDVANLQTALRRFWRQPMQTPLLLIEGSEATFGWAGANRTAIPFEKWTLDLDSLAFLRPGVDDRASILAPSTGVGREPREPGEWNRFRYPTGLHPSEANTAALLLGYVEEQTSGRAQVVLSARIAHYAASLVGSAPDSGGPSGWAVPVSIRIEFGQMFLPPLDAVSPSPSLLAVRAARRAVAANPDNADAWLRLGQAYLALTYSTREHLWADSFRPLAQLRHVQTVSALERAALLDPDLELARALLTRVYSERRMLDASVHHLREQVRIVRERGVPTSDRRLEQLARTLADNNALLQDRLAEFAIRSQGLGSDPFARARIALGLGLSRTALDEVLLRSEVVLYGIPGARLVLELLLMLGRPDRVRSELESAEVRENRERLGELTLPGGGRADRPPLYSLPAYGWTRFLQAAADGDYERAESELTQLVSRVDMDRLDRTRRAELSLPLFLTTEIGLGARPDTRAVAIILGNERQTVLVYRVLNRYDLQVHADLRSLAGALALERGLTDEAAEHFRTAFRMADSPDVLGLGFSGAEMCRAYLSRLEAARK